ncbi:MAG: peptide chain release factor N(5)-glutamine methyltransferase [Actinobacteria bacterium]|nr:peptide chain release factor N(5)-glutamine methyltransferase [Actinomycetota bacterium]
MSDGTVSWAELLSEAEARFGRAGLESPGINARRIVEEASGTRPSKFHQVLDEPATVRGVAHFDAMVTRRENGEPLQYVVGNWSFRELDVMVDHRALIPRPETEVVAGLAIDEVTARSGGTQREVLVADLGTGTGVIALSIAIECPRSRVLATDVSPDALAVARANLTGLGRASTRVTLHEGDWFDALPHAVRGSLDVIVSNPPYIGDTEVLPSVVTDHEPVTALRSGPIGTEFLGRIVDDAGEWLRPDGALVLEMAPMQTEEIAARAQLHGYRTSVHPDLSGRPRAVVARRTA